MTLSAATPAASLSTAAAPTTITPSATNGKCKGSAAASTTTHEQTYTPQDILVTGGAGFIGSHVCLLLAQKYPQYKIVNMDMLDYCSCLDNLTEIAQNPNYKFVKEIICSSDLVSFVLEEKTGPENRQIELRNEHKRRRMCGHIPALHM